MVLLNKEIHLIMSPDERICTNNTITINLEVILSIDSTIEAVNNIKVIEDSEGRPKSFSINNKEYSPMLCFEEVTQGNEVLVSDKDISNILGLQIQTYTDNCSIIFENI